MRRVTESSQRLRFAMGTALALMGALGFATSGPLSESVLAAGVSPLQLSQMRQTVSAAVLLILVLVLRPRALRLRPAELPMVALYGVTSYLLLQTFYFIAISRIPIGIALLIQFTAPAWVSLWVRFVRGTRLPRLTWLAMGLTLIGLVLVGELWNGLRLDAIGVLAALGTALCLTAFYLMAEWKLAEFDPLKLVAWGSVSAAVLFAVVRPVWKIPFHLLWGKGGLPELRWPLWLLLLTIGIVSTAFPAVWEVSAMRFIASPTASVIGTMEVVGGTVLAWILIGQALAVPQVIGGLVVLTGVAINQARPLPREPGTVADPGRGLVTAGLGIELTPDRKKGPPVRDDVTAIQTAEAPDWLRPPADADALPAKLWPCTAHRGPDGEIRLGGIGLPDLADRFGTPAYLFDQADFQSRCEGFRAAFHDFDVYYAGKSFMAKAVVRQVAAAGLSLDVCSEGELAVARAAGFPAERMLLHGSNKSNQELAAAVEQGVGRVVIDSYDEIARLTALARERGVRPAVLLRVTVGIRSDAHAHNATAHEDQKFGFSISSGAAIAAVGQVLDAGVLELRGLHSHIGSQILDPTGFEIATRRAIGLLASIADRHGVLLPELSVGGGFGIAYTEADEPATPKELADRIRIAAVLECGRLGIDPPRLAIEPGRAIVGQSGCTLYRVGTVKRLAGFRTYISVDGGMSDNIRPALFGANYSVALANRTSAAEPTLVRVVGKHCDAGDIVVRDAFLPADIRPGDLLALPATGAYCRSLSNNFNSTPRPPVVGVQDGRAREIIRRETVADLLGLDVG